MNLISHYCKYFKVTKICNIKLKTKTWIIKYNDKCYEPHEHMQTCDATKEIIEY
jgi:hypothetical protein